MFLTKVASVVFTLLGAFLCLVAMIAGGISAIALLDRIQQGRGIMFADVEFFALAAFALLVSGLALLMIARYLMKGSKTAQRTSLSRS